MHSDYDRTNATHLSLSMDKALEAKKQQKVYVNLLLTLPTLAMLGKRELLSLLNMPRIQFPKLAIDLG